LQPAYAGTSYGDTVAVPEGKELVIVDSVQVAVDDRLSRRLVSQRDHIITRFPFQDLRYAASYRKDFIKVEAVRQGFIAVKGCGQAGRADKNICLDQRGWTGAEPAKETVNKKACQQEEGEENAVFSTTLHVDNGPTYEKKG
jgi:hypothetical protein